MRLDALPIFLRLEGKHCLVVGGDAVAARKAELLQRSGARVTVAAPDLVPALAREVAAGRIGHATRFDLALIEGASLVLVAQADERLARHVSNAAQAANVPVNVVDRPELSSFISGAVVERAPIMVAISTAGTSPVLAREIRLAIERLLPPGLGRLARFAERFRAAVRAAVPDGVMRRRFWDKFFEGPIAERVLAGDEAGARSAMVALVNGPERARIETGHVDIVLVGGREADLLTLRAQRLMGQADVLLHDRTVERAILDAARRDAERIALGPDRGEAVRMAAELQRAGKRVVRLVAGDRARAQDEWRALVARGIGAALVPSVAFEIDDVPRAGAVNA
jgi:uroporphyrin-III C-methyltransferase/precorrin-2 dehydrogenase/sirohydrochlorin ferrochelatase